MRRLLVTGGAGFIGTNFVHYWCNAYPCDRIVVLDALTYAGNLQNLQTLQQSPNFSFVRGDICDRALVDKLLISENIEFVVHFAAESHVDGKGVVDSGVLVVGEDVGVGVGFAWAHLLAR